MKACPICGVKFEDKAEFCPKCSAQLEEIPEKKPAEKQKIPRAFWWSLIGAFAFILFMMALTRLFYSLS